MILSDRGEEKTWFHDGDGMRVDQGGGDMVSRDCNHLKAGGGPWVQRGITAARGVGDGKLVADLPNIGNGKDGR